MAPITNLISQQLDVNETVVYFKNPVCFKKQCHFLPNLNNPVTLKQFLCIIYLFFLITRRKVDNKQTLGLVEVACFLSEDTDSHSSGIRSLVEQKQLKKSDVNFSLVNKMMMD